MLHPYLIYIYIFTNHRTTFSTTSSLSCHRIMQIRNITFLETSENITLSYGGEIKWMETPFSRCCGKKMLYYKEWGFDRNMIRIFHLGFVMLGIMGCRTVLLGYQCQYYKQFREIWWQTLPSYLKSIGLNNMWEIQRKIMTLVIITRKG